MLKKIFGIVMILVGIGVLTILSMNIASDLADNENTAAIVTLAVMGIPACLLISGGIYITYRGFKGG